jgi:hypothetical protein
MASSPLNDAIRDVLAENNDKDIPVSNREVAAEVVRRNKRLLKQRGFELAFAELVNRIRSLRKKPRTVSAATERQLVLPMMATDLLPRLPAEIPRYPSDEEVLSGEIEQDELPWGSLWTSTVGELRRYAAFLAKAVADDRARLRAINELLSLASKGGDDEARIIDAVRLMAAE